MGNLLKKVDLFATSQFIRYQGQSSFRTVTGGVVSLAIIIIILIISSSSAITMIQKISITSSTTFQYQVTPQNMTIQFNKGANFMIAVYIHSEFTEQSYMNYFGVFLETTIKGRKDSISFVPCTTEHFSYNDEIISAYDNMNLSNYWCPPFNQSILIGGRQSSSFFSYFTLLITKCNSTANPNCVNDETFNRTFENKDLLIKFSVAYINTIVNPNQQNYLQTYVEDSNYFYFTINNGLIISASIQNFQIDTDQSIMPYTQITTQQMPAVPNPFSFYTFPAASNPSFPDIYNFVYFKKASKSTVYTRSFAKIDDYFSYVGGLIGTMITVFFIMRSYSQSVYLISIAQKIFNYDGQTDIKSQQFNMGQFVKMIIKEILSLCNFKGKWEKTDMFINAQKEMSEQLNIQLLLQKISFFEEAISSLLDDHQLEALYLKDKRSILEAQFIRKKHLESRNIVAQMLQKMNIGQETEQNLPHKFKVNQEGGVESKNELNQTLQNQEIGVRQEINEIDPNKIKQRYQGTQQITSQKQVPHNHSSLEVIKKSIQKLFQLGRKGDQTSIKILKRANRKILKQVGGQKGLEKVEQIPQVLEDHEQSIKESRQKQEQIEQVSVLSAQIQ